jgi:prepilin-type N-terminal cleavage/methylation domain-containing protein
MTSSRIADKSIQTRCRNASGFSLPEILVTVVIIGIFASVAIDNGIRSIQRERVNSIAIGIAGWLQAVQTSSTQGSSCTVTISSGSFSSGDQIASVSQGLPCYQASLTMPDSRNQQSYTIASSTSIFTFTRRGSVSPPPTPDNIISITPGDGSEGRCVAIRGLLGLIELGRMQGGSCNASGRF